MLAGVASLFFWWLMVKSTETWLIVAILAHLILFLHKHAASETSIYQAAAYSLIFFPGLIWWFTKRLSESKKIIYHWSELVFVAFIGYALASLSWASVYGFSLFKGLREFVLFVPYLMYFPLRDYIAENDEGHIIKAFLFVAIAVSIFDVVEYRLSMIVAQYFWQVASSRENVGEPLMVSAIVIMFGFIAAKRYNFYFIAGLIAISALALVLTFSRGYWGTGAFGLLLLVAILKGAPRKRIIKFGLISTLGIILIVSIVFPKLLMDLVLSLGTRIGQLGGQDLSLQSRLSESAVVLNHFRSSPILGYGMGAEYTFFNPITDFNPTTWYIHNGYLFMLYKFGLVGTVLYLTFFLRMLGLVRREAYRSIDAKTRILLLSFFCVIVSMMIVNLTSPQFYDRVAILVLVVIWGVSAGISERNERSESVRNAL